MIRIVIDGQPVTTSLFPTVNPAPYQSTILPPGNPPYAQVPVGVAAVTLFVSPGNPMGNGLDKGFMVAVRNVSTAGQVIGLGTDLAVTMANAGIILNAGDAFTFENIVFNVRAIASAADGLAAVFIARRV